MSQSSNLAGESHRIYWQQWISSVSNNNSNNNNSTATATNTNTSNHPERRSRRELITSSAAVRIAHQGAKAKDVTDLLRTTLNLGDNNTPKDEDVTAMTSTDGAFFPPEEQDSLVLVGTLYSLSRDYVQFEHELVAQHDILAVPNDGNSADKHHEGSHGAVDPSTTENPLSSLPTEAHTTTSNSTTGSSSSSSTIGSGRTADPFHCVKTLHPDDDPLLVRRHMEEHLQQLLLLQQHSTFNKATTTTTSLATTSKTATSPRTIITPKLQWFFVPAANETKSLIPNCVELDGYCTSLEDEEALTTLANDGDDDSEDEEMSGIADEKKEDTMVEKFPWLADETEDGSLVVQQQENVKGSLSSRAQESLKSTKAAELEARVVRENRLFLQLSRSQSALRNHCLSGYLLKRSRRDPHVWRRVHCVLTDEHLWFVSRIYTTRSNRRYARHGRIRLTQALLLEPLPDYVPLHRTPFAFELVSGKGTSHWFRAHSKQLQSRWVQALSDRIVQSFENCLLDQAELILADECSARSRHLSQQAVEPLWQSLVDLHIESQNQDPKVLAKMQQSFFVGAVLRWGMQASSFKECCRHIQTSLPAKNPVVVRSPPRRPSRENSARSNSSGSTGNSVFTATGSADPISPAMQAMIQSAWTRASELLAQATRLTLQMQANKLPRHIETQCQHIEYIILGHYKNDDSLYADPPPMDLFDHLLPDLQILAASAAITSAAKTDSSATN